ncbi:O-antigen ligase family protein [Bacillus thuringiensis]|uniref:O-antigen ligase family protein n=1 Tax=Bacillus thuringiensis TaxID=1428 RepID=UPI0026E2F7C4|nr:O-antigen ligase family protein [Bacillus thuringiensis]MDO6630528.1 O-antigen ligase family protein [Bacillus thuringiensis]MDO6660199.1 O-antigen ligase family protein [Bacillus thuringiensis]MDO6700697.1 O-antigen ligase family protein [Bacillus thuringiensis]
MNISNRWGAIFLILPHLNIYYFNLEHINIFVFLWKVVMVLVAFCLVFKRITSLNLLIVFYMMLILFSAVINENLTNGIAFTIVIFISFCIYISHALKEPKEFFRGMYYLFSVIVIFNFLTMLTNGITIDDNGFPVYLLGGKNAITMTVLPAIPIIFIYSYIMYKKLKIFPLIVILISITSIYLSASGTGIVVAILAALFLIVHKRYSPSLKAYLFIYFILFFTIIVFRLQELLFGDFIINVLHKDLTFTGRTYVWDLILNIIGDSYLIGFGRGNNIINQHFINLYEAHNGLLEILMYSGILGIFFFVIILILVAKKLGGFKNHVISKFLSFSIFVYMIVGLTESVFYKNGFWMLIVISYGINNIIKCIETEDNQLNNE